MLRVNAVTEGSQKETVVFRMREEMHFKGKNELLFLQMEAAKREGQSEHEERRQVIEVHIVK